MTCYYLNVQFQGHRVNIYTAMLRTACSLKLTLKTVWNWSHKVTPYRT